MALANTFVFTKTVINAELMLKAFRNEFRVVAVRNYTDKKGILKDGLMLTLGVVFDDCDYGINKETKQARDNNIYQTFDVTVLDRSQPVKKGDFIALENFDQENSYAINFDLILRFKNLRLLQPKAQTQSQTQNVAKHV